MDVTPCERSAEGAWLKREDLQQSGSFKIRGVLNQVLTEPASAVERGLACVSSGNTGRSLCTVARMLGTSAHVFLPMRTEAGKVDVLESLGASVHRFDLEFDELSTRARRFAADRRMVFCSPGASWPFVHGVGTIALEVLQQAPVSQIYVPVGGGGLAAGIGMAVRARTDVALRTIGVQVDASPYVFDLFHRRGTTMPVTESVADCLVGNLEADAVIRDVLFDALSDVLVVTDDVLLAAQRRLQDQGAFVEAGAAAGFAAAVAAEGTATSCAILTGSSWTC